MHADSGNLEKVIAYIEVGANPNSTTWDGVTPLMYASQNGHYKVARELIASGANVNAFTDSKFTALHYSCISNFDSIAELLILNGADVHPMNFEGISPLHYACAYGYPYLTDLLLYYGAHIDSTDLYGNTPLMAAIYSGSTMVTKILLEQWGNVDKADEQGFTPLMVAAQFNDTTLIRLLTDYGANIYQQNKKGITALALAISSRAEEATILLLEMGAASQEFSLETSYADLSKRHGFNEISNLLRGWGSPYSTKLRVNSLTILVGSAFNGNDFYFSGGGLTTLNKYGLHLGFDMGFRPYKKAVLIEEEYISYQFFEKRNFISLLIAKDLKVLYNRNGIQTTFSIGVKGLRSWANYSYSDAKTKPPTYNLVSPVIEIQHQRKGLSLNAQAYVLNMDHLNNQTFTISLSCGYTFDFVKPKIKPKRLVWF
jgi:ankyrin repeat protein